MWPAGRRVLERCLPPGHQFCLGCYLCSATKSCLTLQPQGLQHIRLPCPPPSPRVCSDSCPLSQRCHLILCHPPLLLPSIFPRIRVFSSESALCSRQTKYWSFSCGFVLVAHVLEAEQWTTWTPVSGSLLKQSVLKVHPCGGGCQCLLLFKSEYRPFRWENRWTTCCLPTIRQRARAPVQNAL